MKKWIILLCLLVTTSAFAITTRKVTTFEEVDGWMMITVTTQAQNINDGTWFDVDKDYMDTGMTKAELLNHLETLKQSADDPFQEQIDAINALP